MLVKDLIKQLESMPQNAEVVFWKELPDKWYSTESCEISVNPYTSHIDIEI